MGEEKIIFNINKGLLVSQRAGDMGTETAFAVAKEVEELKQQGKDIIELFIGQPDFETPNYVKNAAITAIKTKKVNKYTKSAGLPELTKEVAKFFEKTRNISVSPESIVIGSGGKPFIEYAVLCTTDFGKEHEVIFPLPGYPIYESQAKLHGCKPVPIKLRKEKNFEIDVDELKSLITPNTRLLILNSPHNPTGSVLSKKTLEGIAEIVLKNENLFIYSDEVYSNMVYDKEFNSIASVCKEIQERTIMVDCASKTFAMPGWRIGFMSNNILADYFANCMTNTTSCACHLSQEAVIAALKGLDTENIEEINFMKKEFNKRRILITEELNKIKGIECLLPEGAFYAWADVTKLCRMTGIGKYCEEENLKLYVDDDLTNKTKVYPSEELRKRLLYDAGVAVLADVHFGRKDLEKEYLRFSYAASCEEIKEGIKKIKEWVEKNITDQN
jgi:aspartate aminotransferase